jgi:ABC-type antimicrobial peptide transport system permease subunit
VGLTIIGVYAFISYATRQRTQEIGIRVALGAQRSEIFWLISKDALKLAFIGIVAGLIISFLFIKFFAANYWGIPVPDFRSIAIACITLLLVSFLASFAPAVRAAHLDPLSALRGGK